MRNIFLLLMFSIFLNAKGLITEQKYLCITTSYLNLSTGDITNFQNTEQALQTPLRFYITDNGKKLVTDADKKKYRELYQQENAKLKLTYANKSQAIIITDDIDFKNEKQENFMVLVLPLEIKELQGLGLLHDKCIRTNSWTLNNN